MQLDDPNSPFGRRRAGLLLHLTSLPSRYGIGDLGASAHAFCEFLAKSGQKLWQMLPTQPIGPGNSPYSASSAFANEPLLIDLVDLADRGWLTSADLKAPASLGRGDVDFAAVRAFKQPRLEKAFQGFRAKGGPRTKAFQKYCAREAAWLEPWCAFSGGEPELHAFLQYVFDLQWRALRKRAKQILAEEVPAVLAGTPPLTSQAERSPQARKAVVLSPAAFWFKALAVVAVAPEPATASSVLARQVDLVATLAMQRQI